MADSRLELKLELQERPQERIPSETRTIRLDGDLAVKLDELAKQENVSISFIINKALRRHVEWEIYAERFGFMMAFTSKMKRLFEHLTDEEARTMGRQSGENEFSAFINFWFKKLDLETTLKALELLGGEHSRAFRFEHTNDGPMHTIILKHDRGPNTSAYYSEVAKTLFNRLGLKAETVESDQQVTVTVHV